MANDLAEAILKKAKEIEDTENTSCLKLTINMNNTFYFMLTKARQFIRITNIDKQATYRIRASKDFQTHVKQVWRMLIYDCIRNSIRSSPMQLIDRGIGMGWSKEKGAPIALVEVATELLTTSDLNNDVKQKPGIESIINFACLASSPHVSLE